MCDAGENVIAVMPGNPKFNAACRAYGVDVKEYHLTYTGDEIKDEKKLMEKLQDHRPPGTIYDAILYADDTIIYSENKKALQQLLSKIEKRQKNMGSTLTKTNAKL